jgi:hypothetical protein
VIFEVSHGSFEASRSRFTFWRVQRSHEKDPRRRKFWLRPEKIASNLGSERLWRRRICAGAQSTDVASLLAGIFIKIWAEGAWITERHRARVVAFVSVHTTRTRRR